MERHKDNGEGKKNGQKIKAAAKQEKDLAYYKRMIDEQKLKPTKTTAQQSLKDMKLIVCSRKRQLLKHESEEVDCVSVSNPHVRVHECGVKVDLTKIVTNHDYAFDYAFSEADDTETVYSLGIKPLIPSLYEKGTITIFAYGQTGSGKTYTMEGVQKSVIKDMLHLGKGASDLVYNVSYFEIYDGKVFDLLNKRKQLTLLEDAKSKIQVKGLSETEGNSAENVLKVIDFGNKVRSTSQTTANDTSSRSHAICKIQIIKDKKTTLGNLLLIDLAGSEKAQMCQANSRQRRLEGAEINKSLLALKECIRAIDMKGPHIPFRASKLTMVLRDSFIGSSEKTKIVMISCISPGKSSTGDTINTLLYANRLKENKPVIGHFEHPADAKGVMATVPEVKEEDTKLPEIEEPPKLDEPADDKERDWNRLMSTVMFEDKHSFYMLAAAEAVRKGEDKLVNAHDVYLKESDKIRAQEGTLAERLQNLEEQDIDECVGEMEKLAKQKLDQYNKLMEQIQSFKKKLHAEEESSKAFTLFKR